MSGLRPAASHELQDGVDGMLKYKSMELGGGGGKLAGSVNYPMAGMTIPAVRGNPEVSWCCSRV